MPLTLSDEDRAAIDAAYDAAFNPLDRGFARECEAIYLAGMRAMNERAAREIERRFGVCPESGAIRSLLK